MIQNHVMILMNVVMVNLIDDVMLIVMQMLNVDVGMMLIDWLMQLWLYDNVERLQSNVNVRMMILLMLHVFVDVMMIDGRDVNVVFVGIDVV